MAEGSTKVEQKNIFTPEETFEGTKKDEEIKSHDCYILSPGHTFQAKLPDPEGRPGDEFWTNEIEIKGDLSGIVVKRKKFEKDGKWATHFYLFDLLKKSDPDDKTIDYRNQFFGLGTRIKFDREQMNEKGETPKRVELTPKNK